MSHGDYEFGFALIGSETSIGSAILAPDATVIRAARAAIGSGGGGTTISGSSPKTEEQAAKPRHNNNANTRIRLSLVPAGHILSQKVRRRTPGSQPCGGRDRPAPDSPKSPDSPAAFLDSWGGHPPGTKTPKVFKRNQ
jgi:hypothetical protein